MSDTRVVRVDAYTPYGGRLGWLRHVALLYGGDYVVMLRALIGKLARVETVHLVWILLWAGVTVIAIRQTLRSLWRAARGKRYPKFASGTVTPQRPGTAAPTPSQTPLLDSLAYPVQSPGISRPLSAVSKVSGDGMWGESPLPLHRSTTATLPAPPRASKHATVHFEDTDRHFERVLTRLASEDPDATDDRDDPMEYSTDRPSTAPPPPAGTGRSRSRSMESISSMPF